MKKISVIVGVSIIFILAGISCKQVVKQENQKNESDSLSIVSLTPSITKQLLLLNVEDNIVGHTSYCPSDNLENSSMVASATEVNVEKIATLEPDIVLVSTLTKEKVIINLRKLGVKVEYLDMPESFDEICNQMIKIGKLVNKENEAMAIVEEQKSRLDSLQAGIPEGERQKFFIEIGANPLYAATGESFMHDYIRYAKGENIAENLSSGTISRESVIAKDPDVIVIVTMGMVGKEEKDIWEEYQNLSATKKGQIFIIDSDKASSPTPVSFVDVTEEIINLVYYQKSDN
ncbi:MAG: ABC transporter substrate-binding protein [Bacteroidales bacterium]